MAEMRVVRHSMRSEKARISVLFSPVIIKLLSILSVVLMLVGVVMIFVGMATGWALIGAMAIPAMIVEWYNGELHNLPAVKNPDTVDDILDGEILGHLSHDPTPRELAELLGRVNGGQFFIVRFGITNNFLQNVASDNSADMAAVWQQAWELRDKVGSGNITAAILVVAIIMCNPNHLSYLSHFQIDDGDLISGIEWYQNLRSLIDRYQIRAKTGGIARDWSFGWTPLLDRFGQNAGRGGRSESMQHNGSHDESLEQLIGIFSRNGRQNAVLVGQTGSGKTRIVQSFAAKLADGSSKIPASLKYRQVVIMDAAALIAAAPDRGGLERLIPQIMNEAYRAKNIIICLDDAHLFFEDGMGSVNISNILLPILQAGNLRIILAVDEQRFLKIGVNNPEIINALNRIMVEPSNRADTIIAMQDKSIVVEFNNHVTYMYQAFVEAYRLGERYIQDLAMPGRALKLMESAANFAENGLVTAKSVQQAIEKTMDIKVAVASGTDEREKLLNLEDLIHQRMINQKRAVTVVSDALRRARAGVRSQNRPIGTFMFLGPTGVGKTELAKALAAIYFNGEDRIVRIDMNEYSGSSDVSRLIADGADNPNSLTAQVMKQPFCVVLLDEIEKAHSNVLSTLLQMLDEGILRDVKNREVSFRDAIIIATSNAGADRIREQIERGLDFEKFEDQFVDELIKSGQFKPEFLNRFDEIVIFRPLNKPELLQVVDLMIAGVNKTLSLQKVSVTVAADAKEYLVEKGYDPRLGARPMRRVVQRAVENTVAKQMLSGNVEPGSVVEISLEMVQDMLDRATDKSE